MAAWRKSDPWRGVILGSVIVVFPDHWADDDEYATARRPIER